MIDIAAKPNMLQLEPTITPPERLAQLLGVSEKTVRRHTTYDEMLNHLESRIEHLIPILAAEARVSETFIRHNSQIQQLHYIQSKHPEEKLMTEYMMLISVYESAEHMRNHAQRVVYVVPLELFIAAYVPYDYWRETWQDVNAPSAWVIQRWVSRANAARHWQVSETTLRNRLRQDGNGLVHMRFGSTILYRTGQLSDRYQLRSGNYLRSLSKDNDDVRKTLKFQRFYEAL